MKNHANSITCVLALVITVMLSTAAYSQQLLQAFTKVNITGGSSEFGYSVSGAGDVNGDGYDDVIVGTGVHKKSPDRLAYVYAYIYYGGKSMADTASVTLVGTDTLSVFDSSVSGAGDVNGDGYADVIVGDYGYNYDTGRAYIYYGGKSMSDTPGVILKGKYKVDEFGSSVSSAGDVNHDGYSDIIVGAPAYPVGFADGVTGSDSIGHAYIYYGGKSMDSTADVILTGKSAYSEFGASVSSPGDINGDGYSDVIVGAPYYNVPNAPAVGRAYIYDGGNPMDSTADVILTGERDRSHFGSSVSGAGDINEDGHPDVIVGAPGYNHDTGRAYIYYGGKSMGSTPDITLTPEKTGGDFGSPVSGAGDINGDGYDDVIVGASGEIYIYYGGKVMDNTPDVILTGERAASGFGSSVSGAGDVNGDGYDDVIVGAYIYNFTEGRAFIYEGSQVMDTTADVTLAVGANNGFGLSVSNAGDVNGDGYDDVIIGADGYNNFTGRAYIYYEGSAMDGTPDVTLTGEDTLNYFGYSVSDAGDINRDGYADVIVGAYGYHSNTGRAYIYYGGKSMDSTADVTLTGKGTNDDFGRSVSGTGDVNGDGYPDVIVGAPGYNSNTGRAYIYYGGKPMDSTADVIMTGEGKNDYFGFSVSGAGDVNGDGYPDVIVGAPNYNSGTGRAYIYYGNKSLNNTPDITLAPEKTGGDFGSSVSGAGDVNGDGYKDVIVGAPGYDSYTGKAYIYFGSSSMDTTADATMAGENPGDYFGLSVSGAGDVNGDGYADVIVGAPAYGNYHGIGHAYIYYGGHPMDSTADVTMTGEGTGDDFGFFVSGTGDVNNDGHADVIVGAPGYNSNNGKVYLYSANGKSTPISKMEITEPARFLLDQNYPNPFNPSTNISFKISTPGLVSLKIYDVLGREVATLVNRQMSPGSYHVRWNAAGFASGVYFYRLRAGNVVQVKKMLFLK